MAAAAFPILSDVQPARSLPRRSQSSYSTPQSWFHEVQTVDTTENKKHMKKVITTIKKKAVRIRRTQSELFLDSLKKLSKGEQKLISNLVLRDDLGWGEDRYNRIKSLLADDEKKIVVGRGQGGTVGLAVAPGAKPLKIFVSYCHADEPLKVDLLKHLAPLKHLELINVWNDRQIPPGGDWGQTISSNLQSADIILLLVSIDFINSRYCYDIELEAAIERHENKSAVIIPIILRNCMWQHAPFSKIQAIPKDGRPVCGYPSHDEAFTEIAIAIKAVAEDILSKK